MPDEDFEYQPWYEAISCGLKAIQNLASQGKIILTTEGMDPSLGQWSTIQHNLALLLGFQSYQKLIDQMRNRRKDTSRGFEVSLHRKLSPEVYRQCMFLKTHGYTAYKMLELKLEEKSETKTQT